MKKSIVGIFLLAGFFAVANAAAETSASDRNAGSGSEKSRIEAGSNANATKDQKKLKINRIVAHEGCDWVYCWVDPKPVIYKDKIILFQNLLEIAHPDCCSETSMLRSLDGGKTWSDLLTVEGLRGYSRDGARTKFYATIFEPMDNGKFFALVHSIDYSVTGEILDKRNSTYGCIYDINTNKWSELKPFSLGFEQRCDVSSHPQIVRENDDWLIPFYVHFPDEREKKEYNPFGLSYKAVVARCRISSEGEVTVCEKSELLTHKVPRGFCEPALCKFQGRYFLTLRNDETGYIVSSSDWRKWPAPRQLQFDDGQWLGQYNTMTKLVELSGKLYLIYNRQGLNNDHVFRHRAPLLIGEINPETLQVIRSTEQILIPEFGSRLGNFSVFQTSPNTAVVSVAEWAEPLSRSRERELGANNRIWVAQIQGCDE